jgi:rubrerythrin
MTAAQEERIQALEVALNNESRERDFYLKHSTRTSNPVGRLMFQTLANDESEHYQRILDLHERLKGEGKWPETVPLQVKGTEIRTILRDVLATVEALPAESRDDVDAIKIAVDFEAKGVSFYEKLRDNADGPLIKEFFGMLASIEREHFLSLQDALEYFQDPAGWYRTKEKPHVDGG